MDLMVRTHPDHLFNQEIVVVSGGATFDSYGEETSIQIVVTSGSARFQTSTIRVVDAGQIIVGTETRAWVSPTTSGSIGHYVELSDGRKYRINGEEPKIDGKGGTRVKTWILGEVSE
jgi:hypothetical protein